MNIELTKKEYQTLLTMLYCGEWVLNSYKTKEDKIHKETDEIEQFIFSMAKKYGLEKWVEYDESLSKYFPTALMESKLHEFIDKYNQKQT